MKTDLWVLIRILLIFCIALWLFHLLIAILCFDILFLFFDTIHLDSAIASAGMILCDDRRSIAVVGPICLRRGGDSCSHDELLP